MPGKFIISVDLGGTNLKIGLLDSGFKLQDKLVLETAKFASKDKLIEAIAGSIRVVIKRNGILNRNLLGVGVGVPGPVDPLRGKVHIFPNIPGWKDVNLKEILESRLGLRVFLDNDANLMCLAEAKFGAARGAGNAVCLTLGTGVGGGIIIAGNLYRGSSFTAGEIGHIPINENGPRCNCGAEACLEAYVGNEAVKRTARALFKRDMSLEELSDLAKRGNRQAKKIWTQAGERLGVALGGVINFFDPDVIVIGGGVARAGKVLFDAVKKTVSKRAMRVQSRHVRIRPAKLASDAGLIGAAILVKENSR